MSILNVNKINPVGGGSTITIAGIASVTSSVTAPSFVGAVTGNVTGNVTGDATGLSGNPSINTTGIVTATSFVPTVGQLSHRNLVINGDLRIAQRATSSTSSGYQTVDRFKSIESGTDESPTYAQVDVASGTTPYTLGFRKALRVTNGNQTNGAGGGDYIWIQTPLEAQDIANSGWNYTSSSSYVTLSFWVKSSVAQDFKGYLRSNDGTNKAYAIATGSLSADTWTKITKTIPGHSDLQFDNDNGHGLEINFLPFLGTDRTDAGATEDAWVTYSSSARTKDNTSTWYTTNDATFEITGVQLEVGPVSTPFEHRSFADELQRCKRYFQKMERTNQETFCSGYFETNTKGRYALVFPVEMRSAPTITFSAASTFTNIHTGSLGTGQTVDTTSTTSQGALVNCTVNSGGTDGQACLLAALTSQTATMSISAEL